MPRYSRESYPILPPHDVLVILGSGMLGCFLDEELELVARTTVEVVGHSGLLALYRRIGGTVLVSLGRRHIYEGVGAEETGGLVDRAAAAGVGGLIVANAAGGLDPTMSVGDIMLISGMSATMLGKRKPIRSGTAGPRTPLDADLRNRTVAAALTRGVALRHGVYASVLGPSYETRAEVRMLRRFGAHAVGMSTAPEVAAAARHGLPTVGLSLITNLLSDTSRLQLDHTDVVAQGAQSARRMRIAVDAALDALGL